jgi:Ca-activated chloride channel family protein
LLLGLLWAGSARPQGLLIPTDQTAAPLTLTGHHVDIAIEDQVAVTTVTQTFRNPTNRPLEADFVFPVPAGASVKKFAMWVNGKEVKGELVEAAKARTVYTDIVRRLKDPGLLEYLGNNLLRLRVFPVPALGEQKLSLSYTSVAPCDAGLIEYVYPLKTNPQGGAAPADFSVKATLRSQHPIQNVYSPSHAIHVDRPNDHKARVTLEKNQPASGKDFQLFYTPSARDVGLTALTYRPVAGQDGYVMMLISPRAELSKKQRVARDMVFVLDTSGSMEGVKMEQARKALKFCLGRLTKHDRFGLINFATTVNKYRPGLIRAKRAEVEAARHWVGKLQADGGTAIDEALKAALEMRSADQSRSFTVVFFTDGEPTVGETDPQKILKAVAAQNTANTRIFTFGVGDDVNAVLLDKLAEQTRAVSTYVRPQEDIEVKVSNLYAKISRPVLTDLKLTAGKAIHLKEIYPPQLPDLFHGSQLVVLGRYAGKGHAALTLTGRVGKETRQFVYELKFPTRTKTAKAFVEDLWARRKVGYLLDQIRTNGEKKELVDEVVALAKKHGITTPYTSYLVVPDVAPTAPNPTLRTPPTIYAPTVPLQGPAYPAGAPPVQQRIAVRGVLDVDGSITGTPGNFAGSARSAAPAMPQNGNYAISEQRQAGGAVTKAPDAMYYRETQAAEAPRDACVQVQTALANHKLVDLQTGKLGVDFALHLDNLRNQNQAGEAAARQAAGRNCVNVNGVWIDDGCKAGMKAVTVKAQSAAYFRILEIHPEVKEVFRLGNRVVWVTPAKVALVIDAAEGKEKMSDAEIDKLFVAAK